MAATVVIPFLALRLPLAAAAVVARAVRPGLAAAVVALLASQTAPLHLVPPERLDRGTSAATPAPAQKAAQAAVAQAPLAGTQPVPVVGVLVPAIQ
jgi:hypothetical protein